MAWQHREFDSPTVHQKLCMAQPGSALVWGTRGRRFEPCYRDQFKCPDGGMVDTVDSKSTASASRFESGLGYHNN
jgi:hypothetical protein